MQYSCGAWLLVSLQITAENGQSVEVLGSCFYLVRPHVLYCEILGDGNLHTTSPTTSCRRLIRDTVELDMHSTVTCTTYVDLVLLR